MLLHLVVWRLFGLLFGASSIAAATSTDTIVHDNNVESDHVTGTNPTPDHLLGPTTVRVLRPDNIQRKRTRKSKVEKRTSQPTKATTMTPTLPPISSCIVNKTQTQIFRRDAVVPNDTPSECPQGGLNKDFYIVDHGHLQIQEVRIY